MLGNTSPPPSPRLPNSVVAVVSVFEMDEDMRYFEEDLEDRAFVSHSEEIVDSSLVNQEKDESQQGVLDQMQGVFRMLSLVQEEQSSIGSIEKIVIEQTQLKKLCNKLQPSSYKSLANVDYHALDKVTLNLVGIYGNKELIACVLFDKRLFDQETFDQILLSTNDKNKLHENVCWFPSGIYLALTENTISETGGLSASGFAFFLARGFNLE
ncbi:UNVERIFIED_CONTAM: hypothetical protein HDU68_012191 [Siphonaria sp. JEL0065]|nr:hypothetical protein HDU68_012191 [Siphonaria sp. JEL0065]